jgi:hypothetical protein
MLMKVASLPYSQLKHNHAQEFDGTLIGEDGLVVMAGAESVEWYQIHVVDAVPASCVIMVSDLQVEDL